MDTKEIIKTISSGAKESGSELLKRAKPRWKFRWIVSAAIWLIAIIYVGFGIYFSIQIYNKHSQSASTKFASRIFPFPAAIVGGRVVWSNEYYIQSSYINQFSSKIKQPVSTPEQNRAMIIDELIENKILGFEALRYGIRVTSKDVEDAYAQIAKQATNDPNSDGKAEVKRVLNDLYGMSERDFKILVRQKVLKEKVQRELMVHVKVNHILIRDEKRANEVAEKVKKGENFAELAKQTSEDVKSRDKGGELDWIARGEFVVEDKTVKEFDDAVFTAKAGDIVGPIKISAGYEIVKINDRKGEINESYADWYEKIRKNSLIWRWIK